MVACCGHEIGSEWFESLNGEIMIRDFDKEGNKAVSYLVSCEMCLPIYREVEIFPEEVEDWLEGRLEV